MFDKDAPNWTLEEIAAMDPGPRPAHLEKPTRRRPKRAWSRSRKKGGKQ